MKVINYYLILRILLIALNLVGVGALYAAPTISSHSSETRLVLNAVNQILQDSYKALSKKSFAEESFPLSLANTSKTRTISNPLGFNQTQHRIMYSNSKFFGGREIKLLTIVSQNTQSNRIKFEIKSNSSDLQHISNIWKTQNTIYSPNCNGIGERTSVSAFKLIQLKCNDWVFKLNQKQKILINTLTFDFTKNDYFNLKAEKLKATTVNEKFEIMGNKSKPLIVVHKRIKPQTNPVTTQVNNKTEKINLKKSIPQNIPAPSATEIMAQEQIQIDTLTQMAEQFDQTTPVNLDAEPEKLTLDSSVDENEVQKDSLNHENRNPKSPEIDLTIPESSIGEIEAVNRYGASGIN